MTLNDYNRQTIPMRVLVTRVPIPRFSVTRHIIAMTEERIITAAIVTTGEKNDGKQLQALIEKSQATGMDVKTVIGDTAYSEKG